MKDATKEQKENILGQPCIQENFEDETENAPILQN
jgi:hypothetical protein